MAAKEGDLRVWYIPQVPMKAFRYKVPDLKTAGIVEDAMCRLSYFEYQNRVKPDYADASGVERFEDGEWCEVDESEYRDE